MNGRKISLQFFIIVSCVSLSFGAALPSLCDETSRELADSEKRALNGRLYEASQTGSCDEMRGLLQQGASMFDMNREKRDALVYAIESGKSEAVALLLHHAHAQKDFIFSDRSRLIEKTGSTYLRKWLEYSYLRRDSACMQLLLEHCIPVHGMDVIAAIKTTISLQEAERKSAASQSEGFVAVNYLSVLLPYCSPQTFDTTARDASGKLVNLGPTLSTVPEQPMYSKAEKVGWEQMQKSCAKYYMGRLDLVLSYFDLDEDTSTGLTEIVQEYLDA